MDEKCVNSVWHEMSRADRTRLLQQSSQLGTGGYGSPMFQNFQHVPQASAPSYKDRPNSRDIAMLKEILHCDDAKAIDLLKQFGNVENVIRSLYR